MMRIEPRIAERHWEAAAVEQMAERLRAEGYKVQRDVQFEGLRADLVARKGRETVVYEFKSPSTGGEEWSRAVSLLRDRAVEHGARFHIVFVRPPRESQIQIEGIERVLEEALREHFPAELDELSDNTRLEDISRVEINAIEVRQNETVVEGEATVSVSLNNDEETWATEYFPFTFDIVLDRDGKLKEVSALEVDTTSWFGDAEDIERASDDLETRDAPGEADSRDF
jgi:Predicted pPIWI-associating nuclease